MFGEVKLMIVDIWNINYLSFGSCNAQIATIFSLTRDSMTPDDNPNTCVGKDKHRHWQDVLKDEQSFRINIRVVLSKLGPIFFAHIPWISNKISLFKLHFSCRYKFNWGLVYLHWYPWITLNKYSIECKKTRIFFYELIFYACARAIFIVSRNVNESKHKTLRFTPCTCIFNENNMDHYVWRYWSL